MESNAPLQWHITMRTSQQTTQLHVPSDVGNSMVVEYMVQINVIGIDVDEEHTPLTFVEPMFVDSEHPLQCSSQCTQVDTFNPIIHFRRVVHKQLWPQPRIHTSLALKAKQLHVLHDHLIAGLRLVLGKQNKVIAQGVTKMPLTPYVSPKPPPLIAS